MQFIPSNQVALNETEAVYPGNFSGGEGVKLFTTAAMNDFKAVYTPTLISMGLVSNSLLLVTLQTAEMKKTLVSSYIVAIATIDICFLLVLLVFWLDSAFGVELYNKHGWPCHMLTFLGYVCEFLVIWYNAGLASEAYISFRQSSCHGAAWFPMWRPRIVIVCLASLAVVAYLNISLLYGVAKTPGGDICMPVPYYLSRLQILSFVDSVVNVLLPCALTLIFVAALVMRWLSESGLWKSGIQAHAHTWPIPDSESPQTVGAVAAVMTFHGLPQNGSRDTETEITRSVLLVTCFNLLLSFPSQLLRFWVNLCGIRSHHFHITPGLFFWQQVLIQVYFSRFAVNFFLYLLAWPSFRKCLKHRLCTRRHRSSSGMQQQDSDSFPDDSYILELSDRTLSL